MLGLPYGGLVIKAGTTGLSLTTTAAAVTNWNNTGGAKSQADSSAIDGDVSVQPDVANSRIKLEAPGIYLVSAYISGFGSVPASTLWQIRKNGATLQGDLAAEADLEFNNYNFTASLSPAQVAANTSAEQTFTVTGLLTTDQLMSVIKPTAQAGLAIVGYRISAANTVAITFGNFTAAGITPTATETYNVNVSRVGKTTVSFSGILKLASTDLPTGGGLATFADPSDPAPSYVGAGGAPKTMTYIELMASTISGTATFTVEYGQFSAVRVG